MSLRINNFDVELVDANAPGSEHAGPYSGFGPSKTILSRGHKRPGRDDVAAFQSDAVWEKDFAVPMRDGVTLRADIFRPTTDQKVPAILCWSPYGKDNNGELPELHGYYGKSTDAGNFQAYMACICNRAVLVCRMNEQVHTRSLKVLTLPNGSRRAMQSSTSTFGELGIRKGSFRKYDEQACIWIITNRSVNSWFGKQDGQDGYDAVEFIAQLPWCSGKVATAGNSWLAVSQWFIAAGQPPHLAAIAPWEGAADFYRDTLARGGIPYPYDLLWGMLQDSMVGRGKAEAVIKMLKNYPLYNDYWEDKRAKLENIQAPAYVLASYSTSLHTSGSISGFNEISSKEKWYVSNAYPSDTDG